MRHQKLVAELREIAGYQWLKLRVYKAEKPFDGYYDHKRKTIHLATRGFTRGRLLNAFFHEMGHAVQAAEGQNMAYHSGYKPGYEYFTRWAKEGLIAEAAADVIGGLLMDQYYPDTRYQAGNTDAQFIHQRVEMIGRENFPGRKCPICGRVL